MRRQNENVADVRERRGIGDYARESDLTIAVEYAETDRVLDRTLHEVARDVLRPVRFLAQIAVDHLDVESRLVRADRVHGASMQQFVDEKLLRRADRKSTRLNSS